MKVAVVYNISHADLAHYENMAVPAAEINFEPYFDIEHSSPLDGYNSITRALCEAGFEAYSLNIFDDYNAFLADYRQNRPDVVFNMVEYYNDKPTLEMNFACLLQMMDIPYTGAPPMALATCQRKVIAKSILSSLGINTPRFRVVSSCGQAADIGLNYPLIVKPSMEDASLGIEDESVVNSPEKLFERIEYILHHFKQNALIEEFVDGRELNVAVIGDRFPRVLPISEIDFSLMPAHLNNIVSYQAKWDPYHEAYHMARPICPSILPSDIEAKAKDLALKAFKALGARDYARVDMRLSRNNELFVLEINPNPDLTEDAGFMRSSKAAGYSFRRTLRRIVEMAWTRRSKAPKQRLPKSDLELSLQ
ncbi:MAG: D-alanine--D-alanine ligase [Ignavibacteria bacterium]|nr:D-alanine--D-alanine ligase [Ignavibacteria bacterium]MCU7502779.1 D-alanine--D-alanine ligase [Ignavibacteria bacterium]MCU7518381.1 D-alanine--D-alanine ligase [Ignavibacteria bacterium]